MTNMCTTEQSEIVSMKDEYARRELHQKRHYFLFSELQNMAREIPGKYQQRLPYDLLSSLANALIDATVFEIVHSLKEVQQLEEKNLFNQRNKLVNDHKAQKHEMQRKHREMLQTCQPHNQALVQAQIDRELETLERRCEEEVRRKDMKIILELDQKLIDQQNILEKAGVPGFFVTNKPQDIRLQMYLLEFIQRLSQMEMPT
ncbi:hypothetical protein CHS0354_025247 [Potamilus streckersoni]|uniref:DGCR6 n=1 Tax=Potamilus streckersoni TaxID=2493646 RepID=A0AAE0VIW5_9BIVA|nr:hypothetical protein CHS0354_025247 [Potamilus streckersoni]